MMTFYINDDDDDLKPSVSSRPLLASQKVLDFIIMMIMMMMIMAIMMITMIMLMNIMIKS